MRVCGVVCVAAMLFPLYPQDATRAGNQIFRMPSGWTRTDSGPSTILTPGSEPRNMVVLMLNGRSLNADFRAMFDQDLQAMRGSQRVVSGGEVQSGQTPQGVELLATTLVMQATNGARSWCYYLAANVGGRFESMVFIAASQAAFQRYYPAVQQLADTRTFANLTNSSAPPADAAPPADVSAGRSTAQPPAPGRLDGVYGGYKFNYTTTLGAVQRTAVHDYFSFFPDGTVYHGLPQSGLAGFNMARECQREPIFCGTYNMTGDRILILLNRGTYRQVGSRTAGGLHIEDRDYTLLGDLAKSAAHVLEGVWVRADARPGEDLARKSIRFTRDGQFVDQGIVLAVTNSEIINGNPRFERPSGMGTYRIGPYTVILRYADGYQRPLAIALEPADMDKPALSRIYVNTYTLVRR